MTLMTTHRSPIRVSPDHERRYAGADKLATEVVLNLFRTESLVSAALTSVLRPHGLSLATFNVLMVLQGAGAPLCPREIADQLVVTGATITGLLDSLEKKELVRRSPHPGDRRMLLVTMTPKGKKLLSSVLPSFFPSEAELVSALTGAEKQTLVRLLGKIEAHLGPDGDRASGRREYP
jgi:DNA-binding MarR family transcriptional regulator